MGILSKKKIKEEEPAKLRSEEAPKPDYQKTYEEPPKDEPLPGEEVEALTPEPEVAPEVTPTVTLEEIGFRYQLLLHDLRILVAEAQFQQAKIRKEEWVMLLDKDKLEGLLKTNGVSEADIKKLQEEIV